MNYRNAHLILLLFLLAFPSSIFAQPQLHIDELKTEALQHMKSGRYGEAINLLNNYISAKPQQADGYNLRGLAYEHRGQYEQAVYDFRSAKKLEPENSEINENLNRTTNAWYKLIYNEIEGYKREIAINPSKPVNYLQIGKSYKNLGEWAEAESWYDKYLGMENASPDEIIRYTEILAKNNHIAKGEPILKKFTEDYPDDQRLWSRYGYFSLWLGKTQNAIHAFEKALEIKPFFKEAMDGLARAKGNGYIYTFNDTVSYRNYKHGIKTGGYPIDNYFIKLKKNPDDNETRKELINALMKVNRFEEAYQQLLILKKKEGDTAEVQKLYDAVISARDNYYKNQIAEYEKKLKENPGSKDILLKLAGYYTSVGNYLKAIDLYADYLSYYPNDAEVRFLYIQNAAWNKQYQLAGNELDVLIIQYPDSIKYELLRARINVWQNKDLTEAEKLLNKVLAKDPNNFEALLTMAVLNYQKNNFDKANQYASLAGEIDPFNPEVEKLKFNISQQQKLEEQNQLFSILEEAREKVSQNDCKGAISLYEKYKSLTHPAQSILEEEADAYICLKDYNSALNIYDEILNQNYDFRVDKKRALLLLWSNNPLKAVSEFERLTSLHPENSELQMYLADSYFQLKEYDKAEKIYNELLKKAPGSKLIETRLGWFGEANGSFSAFNFPAYLLVNPEGLYYFDNYDFKYSLQGLTLETGINNFISIGVSGNRSEFDSANTSILNYSVKGILLLKINRILSLGFSAGETFFGNDTSFVIGSGYFKAEDKNYSLKLNYISDDAAKTFYSPFLISRRLRTDIFSLSGDYKSSSGIMASTLLNYYLVSDKNQGGNLQLRLGKRFDELAAGYEFYHLSFKNFSKFYYSPAHFQSHSLWGEWYLVDKGNNQLKIGGKVGIIPENNFILREAFASASLKIVNSLVLQGRISTGSTIRENTGYSSSSFYLTAFWNF